MGKILGVLLVILLIPAILYSYGLYEKAYLKADLMTVESLLLPKIKSETSENLNVKEKKYQKNLFYEYNFVRFFQESNESQVKIGGVFSEGYRPQKVFFRACDKENSSATYQWQEIFNIDDEKGFFTLEIEKNEICPTNYYFKFENEKSIDFADYKVFSESKKFDKSVFIDIFKFYELDISNLETTKKDNFIEAKISKQDCEKLSKNGKENCSSADIISKIELLGGGIFKVGIYKNPQNSILFERYFDFNRQTEIFNNDSDYFVKIGDENVKLKANFVGNKLITSKFLYNVANGKIIDLPYNINKNLTHFYKLAGEKIQIIPINSNLAIEVSGINPDDFSSNFVEFNDNIFVILENQDSYYFGKIIDFKVNLQKDKIISDLSNNCNSKKKYEILVKNKEIFLTSKCEQVQDTFKLSSESQELEKIKNP